VNFPHDKTGTDFKAAITRIIEGHLKAGEYDKALAVIRLETELNDDEPADSPFRPPETDFQVALKKIEGHLNSGECDEALDAVRGLAGEFSDDESERPPTTRVPRS
jgi:hypothetical protein